jgi:hypothetical protein
LIANKGAEGFLSQRVRNNVVDSGWDPLDRKKVEDKLYSFGMTGGRRPIGVTNKDLQFIRLSVPVNEFMPIEIKEHEFRTICTSLLFPSKILNDTKASTYNNMTEAQKAFYTDCLQPVVNLIYQTLTNNFKLNERGEALKADWSEVECLQEDKKIQNEITQSNDKIWKDRYESNLITLNEYLISLGLQMLPNGNTYARDNKDIPLAIRIGVGGTQSLQAILSDANLTIEQKVNIIIVVFGISKEEANSMLGSTQAQNNNLNIGDQPNV